MQTLFNYVQFDLAQGWEIQGITNFHLRVRWNVTAIYLKAFLDG